MTKRLTTLVALVLLTGAALVAGATSPAAAERGSQDYVRDNAPAGIDITKLTVRNAAKRFTMTATVRDLGESGRFNFHYWSGRRPTPPKRSLIIVVRRVEGATSAEFLRCGRDECFPDTCDTLRAEWDPAADVVEVSAPQRCYPRANPDADPPDQGRFGVWSRRGRHHDTNPGPQLLLLARG